MHEHTGRLNHHGKVFVLVNHLYRNILRTHRVLAGGIQLDLDKVTASHAKSDVLQTPVYLALFIFDYPPEIHPAETRELAENKLLQTCPTYAVRNYDFDAFGHRDILF